MKNKSDLSATRFFVFLILGQLLLASLCAAQEPKPFATKGVVELGGSISYQYSSTINRGVELGHMNLLSILPYAGYFVTDNIEIGVNPLGIQTYWYSGNTTTAYKILIAPAYNFNSKSDVFPFLEAQIGYTAQTNSGTFVTPTLDGLGWGGRGGVKIVMGGNGLLNLGVQYQETTLSQSGATSRTGSNVLMISAGFTIWL
jgi:hypothetical protein